MFYTCRVWQKSQIKKKDYDLDADMQKLYGRSVMKELDYGKMGMRIRQVRKAKGWSQEELAKKCGISMSFLGHIERGTRIMSLETFVSICSVLEAGADELLWGIAHPSEVVLDMWKTCDTKRDEDEKGADSYAMYIRIMKSVAEIMNEA